ncbi:hypothetical protein H0266_08805 [Halobacillus locisalis]|uniref:Uncharacterized protein n=1 Tax=Halobacillus locisalis TaxID=220753 RepID=A0A838CSK3_9BACI|nr:hypothetical protein [Halobacillus locisalis]MBA2174990.1 hypothetical protein [Halobacillus locisalis]
MGSIYSLKSLTDLYESMMMEVSYDLHENCTHLLMSALHYLDGTEKDIEESKKIISYTINVMKAHSKEVCPYFANGETLQLSLAPYMRGVERRYGVPVFFTSDGSLPLEDELPSFRYFQLVLQWVMDQGGCNQIVVDIAGDTWKVVFSLDNGNIYDNEKGLRDGLKNDTNMKVNIFQRPGLMECYWKKGEIDDDTSCHRG